MYSFGRQKTYCVTSISALFATVHPQYLSYSKIMLAILAILVNAKMEFYFECLCDREDVADIQLKQKFKLFKECNEEGSFQTQLNNFLERFDYGYNKPNPTLSDKDYLLKKVSHHQIISLPFISLQFLEGLSSFGVLNVLRGHPSSRNY